MRDLSVYCILVCFFGSIHTRRVRKGVWVPERRWSRKGRCEERVCIGTHIDDQILDRECGLGALLDLDAIFVAVTKEDIRHVSRIGAVLATAVLFDAHHAWVNASLNHVRLEHADRLLRHLIRRNVHRAVRGAGEHGRDESRRKVSRRRAARRSAVLGLQVGGEKDLEGGEEERARVPFVHVLRAVFLRRVKICENEPYDGERRRGGRGKRSHARLVRPRQSERQSVELAFLWRFVDGLDNGLYPHRHLVIRLVSSNEPAEALQPRGTPRLQEEVDNFRGCDLEVVYHAEGLALKRDGRWLACRTYPCGPVRMTASWARLLDAIIRLYQWWQRGCCRGGSLGCELAEIGVIGKVFNTMLLVVFPVIRLQRHAIIAHSIGSVLAEISISTSGNIPVPCSPVLVHGIFFDLLPRSACRRGSGYRCASFLGSAVLGSSRRRLRFVRDKNELAVSKGVV